ncbi:MAG: ATP-dependent helicase, partial [Desulfobulbus sp.]|nr:ATP-dependent helicase [Desulfobulbus sp.]
MMASSRSASRPATDTARTNVDLEDVAALPAGEQLLLELISVIYEPVSTAFLTKCLAALDPPPVANRRLGEGDVGEMAARLRRKGLLNSKNQCPPLLAEQLTRQAVASRRFRRFAALVEKAAPVDYMHGKWVTRCWRALRQFRIGVYSQDFDRLDEALAFLEGSCRAYLHTEPPAVLVTASAFDPVWFGGLPGSLQFFLLDQVIRHSLERLHLYPDILAYLEDGRAMTVSVDERVPFRRLLASCYLLQGRLTALRELLERFPESFAASGFAGTAAFLGGDTDLALCLYDEDLVQLQRYAGSEPSFFLGITGLFCIFALLARDGEGDRDRIRQAVATVLRRCNGCPEELPFRFLDTVLRSPDEVMPDMLVLTESLMADERCLTSLVAIMSLYWMGVEIPSDFQESLRHLHDQAMRNDFLWVAMESAELLATLDDTQTAMRQTACALARQLDCRFLTNIIAPHAPWKQSLEELVEVTRRMREPERTTRLCWLVEYRDGNLELIPKEQRRSLAGEWTKGRTIAFKRLFLGREIDYLTSQDREICAALREVDGREGRNSGYAFDPGKALPALIGHPAVFLRRSPETPVEIVAGEPELVVERRDDALFIHFCQDIGEGQVAVWPETGTRYRVIQIRDEHRRVARITGRDGLLVPMAASKKVLAAIGNIASFMTVHSSIEVPGEGLPAEAADSDATPHVH